MEQEKNPMQKIKYFLYAILVLSAIIVFNSFMQPIPIKAEEKSTTINNLLQEQYYKELSLNLPSVTDSQNLEIVFANPNDPKKYPITIIIDNKKFEEAKSPFKLPYLEIGTHTITIKYTNKDGIPRTLSTLITVVPRAPILNRKNKTLFYRPEPITISGKALAFSKIMVIINSTKVEYIPVDSNGQWELTIKNPSTGITNLLFFTYKNGIISKNHAKITVKYNIHSAASATPHTTVTPIPSHANSFIPQRRIKNLLTFKINNLPLIVAIFLLITYLILIFKKLIRKRWEQQEISQLILKYKPHNSIVDVVKSVQRNTANGHKQKTKKGRTKKVVQTTHKQQARNSNIIKKRAIKHFLNSIEATDGAKILIQKKVLSKEEFLSMFKKSKNKS